MVGHVVAPPATIGMLGGGQLGRYALIAARRMGYRTVVLEPDARAPAGAVADEHLVAAYDDEAALDRLAACVRRGHDGVREPTRGVARAAGAFDGRRAVGRGGGDRPGPAVRETLPRRDRDTGRAMGCGRVGRRPSRRRVPRDPEDGTARLRRQGADRDRLDRSHRRRVDCSGRRRVRARAGDGARDGGQRRRRPHRRRTDGHLRGVRESPRRRCARSDGGAGPGRRSGCRSGDRAGAGRRRCARLCRRARRRVVRRRRPVVRQRTGATPAQQRALDTRRGSHQPVRTAGQGGVRDGSRGDGDDDPCGGDGQPARRPLAARRARLGDRARCTAGEPPSLRQGRRPAGPQDGAPHRHR